MRVRGTYAGKNAGMGKLKACSTEESDMIRLKRAYDPPEEADGARYLVERLWPRGIKKENARLTAWLKDVSPSPELRKWYGHVPDRWPEFQKRYREELRDDEHRAALETLRAAARRGPITLVYAAKDEERNSALIVKQVLSPAATG
jgi:uncharacterized protein YeaO (DUF488 family)